MEILYSPKFARQYKKLSVVIQEKAEICESWFREDPFDPRLKTHKLSGTLEGFYAFSVNFSHRIIFDFQHRNIVRFYQIGTHDIYDA